MLGPKMPEWLQMLLLILHARPHERPGEIEALWEGDAVNDKDRAKAVFWALYESKANIGAWFLRSPRFQKDAVLDLIESRNMGPGFHKLFFFQFNGRRLNADVVDVLAVAIARRVPLIMDGVMLTDILLQAGGVALADLALRNGYPLEFGRTNYPHGVPANCSEQLFTLLRSGGAQGVGHDNSEFWDAKLRLGQDWRDAVFASAFLCGDFAAVEKAVQQGALRGVPRAPQGAWSLRPQEWLHDVRLMLRSTELRKRWLMQTSSDRRIIYVAELVDQQMAASLAPVIEQDREQRMEAGLSFFCWWEKQDRKHGGAPCNIPDIKEAVLDLAGLHFPQMRRQAAEVAAVIRNWL
jgi:hypothetical protein